MLNTFQGLHARHYDLIYADKPYAAEALFLHQLLGGKGGRLLDVCCGSGRHAVELALLGWETTGVDYNAELLARARSNAAAAGVDAAFQEQDMRHLELPQEYDAVTCLFDSIGYPVTNEGIVAALSSMRGVLAATGWLVVEFLHAPALLMHAEPVRVRRWKLADAGELLRISETDIDPIALVMHVSYELLELGGNGRYTRATERQSNRLLGLEEMRALMTLAGLRVDRFVAAYKPAATPIDADVFHVLAVAEAA